MKKTFSVFLLFIFLFCTGFESVSFIAEKLIGKKNTEINKYECPEENKAPEKEDGKEEKEGEKNLGKEYAEHLYVYESFHSAIFHQIDHRQKNGLSISSGGFSGEIFSPPELV